MEGWAEGSLCFPAVLHQPVNLGRGGREGRQRNVQKQHGHRDFMGNKQGGLLTSGILPVAFGPLTSPVPPLPCSSMKAFPSFPFTHFSSFPIFLLPHLFPSRFPPSPPFSSFPFPTFPFPRLLPFPVFSPSSFSSFPIFPFPPPLFPSLLFPLPSPIFPLPQGPLQPGGVDGRMDGQPAGRRASPRKDSPWDLAASSPCPAAQSAAAPSSAPALPRSSR